jgi:hypothetical protein
MVRLPRRLRARGALAKIMSSHEEERQLSELCEDFKALTREISSLHQ